MDILWLKKGVIPWACFHWLFTAFSRTFHWLFTAFSRFRIFRNLFAVSVETCRINAGCSSKVFSNCWFYHILLFIFLYLRIWYFSRLLSSLIRIYKLYMRLYAHIFLNKFCGHGSGITLITANFKESSTNCVAFDAAFCAWTCWL